jgi:F420-dependent hydroxymycolic acid dehydrogenase
MASIGYVLSSEQFLAAQLIQYGASAERAGFDMVWCSDHLLPWQHNQGHASHAWITLAALGQQLSQIAMGTGVTCPTYRYNPVIVAQAFASLGMLYPGRVFLGVGTGEAINEESATGQWGDHDERLERLVEAVQLIRDLWTGDWITHNGKYYHTRDVKIYDVPEHRVPIYVAASGENALYQAGRIGDGLITDAETIQDAGLMRAFREGAKSAGKDPADMTIHVEMFVFVGEEDEADREADLWRFIPKAFTEFVNNPDPRDIQRKAEANIDLSEVKQSWIIAPDGKTHIEAIQELQNAGATHLYIHSAQADQQRVIDFYADEVLNRIPNRRLRFHRDGTPA